ncbi:hypothetical protein CkP1_0118 [Citrobacter phage CkP1]|nr:hypothetical protein CkP1_0118 [Citrobacter phage CkP1]
MAQTHITKGRCAVCHWPVISALCNDGMSKVNPYNRFDWWYYCSNKTCQHHKGEGVFQYDPEWLEDKDPK